MGWAEIQANPLSFFLFYFCFFWYLLLTVSWTSWGIWEWVLRLSRDQNGFWPKSLRACNAELGGVCTCMLNEPQMKHPLRRGVWGSSPRSFWLLASQMVHSSAILGHCTPIPLSPPLQKIFLFRFTLISRIVLGVRKKSEIRLKSENYYPCLAGRG